MSVLLPDELSPSTDILQFFASQGEWQNGDYSLLPRNRLVELVDGLVEVLLMPSLQQFLTQLIFLASHDFCESRTSGVAMMAPCGFELRTDIAVSLMCCL